MHPTLIEIETANGPMGVHTYGLFIVAAFSAAFLYTHFRAIRIGLHPDRLIAAYVSAAIGGLLGGRILYAIAVDFQQTLANPLSLFSCSGFAVYGGIIGGTIGVGVFAYFSKINLWKLADIAGPSVLIGMGVGRFGCFFAGCCHGAPAPVGDHPVGLLPEAFGGQLWLSDVFPFLTMQFDGGPGAGVTRPDLLDLPLYPTQTWSIIALLSLAGFLAWLWTKRRFDGQIAALTLMAEPPFRIAIESFRADERGYALQFPVNDTIASWLPGLTSAGSELEGAMMGVTTSQFIGLLAMASGLVIYVLRYRAGVQAEEPLLATDDDLLEELA